MLGDNEYKEALMLLVDLHILIKNGNGDTDQADAIRERMDSFYGDMSELQRNADDAISVALYASYEEFSPSYLHIKNILDQVKYKDWTFYLGQGSDSRMYLQIRFMGACTTTGKIEEQRCRKWWISPHMCESELVTTAYKAVLAAEEHEAKEGFKYKDKQIYNPHIDVNVLAEVCDRVNVRG